MLLLNSRLKQHKQLNSKLILSTHLQEIKHSFVINSRTILAPEFYLKPPTILKMTRVKTDSKTLNLNADVEQLNKIYHILHTILTHFKKQIDPAQCSFSILQLTLS